MEWVAATVGGLPGSGTSRPGRWVSDGWWASEPAEAQLGVLGAGGEWWASRAGWGPVRVLA
ncbi:hypothetical protein [Kribbella sp. NPDC049584]|uniref:hypothetical protein n=1 Tax=Kribbella sp. NPDC049584 TaxID=3154833 RepID=UPI00343F96FD